jgi:demethylmenaquinone methyltransferase/2-methoxy-6-polyprenyl-1,4-benzoquinol methylase
MFAGIAPRYDLINHVLSFNIDRSWRKALIESVKSALQCAGARVLDLCCGTGDVLIDMQAIASAELMGADFCHPMLVTARAKAGRNSFATRLFEADALQLPLPGNSLNAISIAFGFRNLANYKSGLAELHRVLRTGGILAILEFSHPRSPLVKTTYGLYSRVLLPLIGGLISGSSEAYSYLPDSIRKFPGAEELRTMMEDAGYVNARFKLLSGGIAALHTAQKAD